ncbi:gag-pol polyprotein [Tanacetum coccineum]
MAVKFKIEKFNGNNFSLWKLKMKAILRKDKCLAAIGERPAEVTDDSKWDEMDGNAIANLHLALADGVLSSIEEKKSAKEIWDHLARLYEARSLHNKNFLKRKLYALRMTESTSVTEHVNNLNTLFSQLTSLSCIIEPQERAEILLQSLPDSYDQVIINLTSNVLSDYLVFDDVAAAILEEENRRNNREDRQTISRQVEALVVTRGRSMELGSSGSHNHASTSEDGNALCCEAAVANESRSYFPYDRKKRMYQGQLDDLGCKVEIQNKIIKIIKGALVLMRGEKVAANLYQLKGEIMEEVEASVASHSPSHKVAVTWHQKPGHMSEQGMKILVREANSWPHKRLPYLLLHPGQSLEKQIFWYHLLMIIQRGWVYPIKKKSDVFEVFKVYKARVELDSGKKIKCLRTNNGGEYTSDEFDTFCRQEGIKRQFTTAYTPQQNGMAERMNRTLLERARAMLAIASLGKLFWAKAANIACYVINRSPSIAVELKTPMEMWTGRPVNYSDLHIFESPVKVVSLVGPTAHKVVVSRDVVFMKDKIQKNKEGDSTTRETTSIQMEKEFQSNDSFEAAPQHEVNETNESQAPATGTLNRKIRCPGWHSNYVMENNVAYCLLTEEGEPSTLQEALNNLDVSFWKKAMQEEIEALHKNKT